MKKRLFSLFMSLIMAISLVGVVPTMTASASKSGDYEYSTLSNGTVVITRYNGSATNLTIPSTIAGKKVTSIGACAFEDCERSLESVTIPNSVTSIGDNAFEYCSSLTSITIPNSVTSIGESAFWKCHSLKSVTIPNSVTSIGNRALAGCTSIKSINVDFNNKNYSSKDGILFNKGKTELIQYPIGNARTSYTIPNNVTSIGDCAFLDCHNLKSVTIPDSVKNIREYAFLCCTDLKCITIPNSVKYIGEGAFGSYVLTRVTISNSLTYYGFTGCTSLKDVYYAGTQKDWNKTNISSDNSTLQNAKIHYNFDPNHIHSYISTVTKQPTCTTTGTQTRKCSICGKTETQTIKATGHKYTTTVVKPTYSAQGYTLHKCSTCGNSYKDNYKAKLTLANITKANFTSSANAVKMSWNKVSGATGYRVYKYNTSTKKWQTVANTKNTYYTFSKLKSGTTYKFTVRAYRTEGGKTYLSPKYSTFTTSTNPATVNFKLTAGSKKATVKWSKVTGATGYKVYYKTSKNGKWTCLKTANNKTTSYTKTGLKKGKTYYFTVKAYRTVGGKTYNGAFTTKSVKVK